MQLELMNSCGTKVGRVAGEWLGRYFKIADAHRQEIHDDPLAWAELQVKNILALGNDDSPVGIGSWVQYACYGESGDQTCSRLPSWLDFPEKGGLLPDLDLHLPRPLKHHLDPSRTQEVLERLCKLLRAAVWREQRHARGLLIVEHAGRPKQHAAPPKKRQKRVSEFD